MKFFNKYLPIGLSVILLVTTGLFLNVQKAHAAISLVTHLGQGSTNGNTFTTSSIDTTGSTLLVVAVSDYAVVGAGTITDSNGNSWHSLTASTNSPNRETIWYAYDKSGSALVVGAGHTFTYTNASTAYPALAIEAFSGTLTGSDPFDQQNTGNGSGNATTGNITPGQNNEVIISGGGGSVSAGSVDAYFTSTDVVAYSGGAHYWGGAGYAVQTTATTKATTWSGGGGNVVVAIASFKVGVASTPSVPHAQVILNNAQAIINKGQVIIN